MNKLDKITSILLNFILAVLWYTAKALTYYTLFIFYGFRYLAKKCEVQDNKVFYLILGWIANLSFWVFMLIFAGMNNLFWLFSISILCILGTLLYIAAHTIEDSELLDDVFANTKENDEDKKK